MTEYLFYKDYPKRKDITDFCDTTYKIIGRVTLTVG